MEISILIDTNVIISALFFDKKPLQIIFACIKSRLGLYPIKIRYIIPQYVRDEVQQVISRKFQSLFTYEKRIFLLSFFDSAENITYNEIHPFMKKARKLIGSLDENDIPVVAAALASKPDFLITGNKKHFLELNTKYHLKVVSPSEFLDELNVLERTNRQI